MKVKVWLDTGVNIHSKFKVEVDVDEFGYTEEEWEELDHQEQFQVVLDMCYGLDWGVDFIDTEEAGE